MNKKASLLFRYQSVGKVTISIHIKVLHSQTSSGQIGTLEDPSHSYSGSRYTSSFQLFNLNNKKTIKLHFTILKIILHYIKRSLKYSFNTKTHILFKVTINVQLQLHRSLRPRASNPGSMQLYQDPEKWYIIKVFLSQFNKKSNSTLIFPTASNWYEVDKLKAFLKRTF